MWNFIARFVLGIVIKVLILFFSVVEVPAPPLPHTHTHTPRVYVRGVNWSKTFNLLRSSMHIQRNVHGAFAVFNYFE